MLITLVEKMPRKNKKKNKSNNFYPQSGPYYSNHNNYNMYQEYPNNYDDYNYHTRGRFQNRLIGQTEYQNIQYTNGIYRYGNYNNLQYSNWGYPGGPGGHMITDYTNEVCFNEEDKFRDFNNEYNTEAENIYRNCDNKEYTQREDRYRDYNNEEHSQTEETIDECNDVGFTNKEYTGENIQTESTNKQFTNVPPVDRVAYDMSSDSSCGAFSIEVQENKVDNLLDTNVNRPSARTILKKSLKEKSIFPKQYKKQKVNSSYTDNYWKKGKESEDNECKEIEEINYVFQLGNKPKKKKKSIIDKSKLKKANKFEQKVNEMLSAPVEMSKGRSLLEKMGWKGGGLGKDGDGIVEPIAPKAIYAATTMGLGQLTKEEPEVQVVVDGVYLKILTYILEFVKNYLENELKFEASLSRIERKRIHRTVEELRNGVEDSIPYPYRTVVKEIYHYNNYLLTTESSGKKQKRYLTLYKEAHDHMFVVSPEDLDYEEEITDKDEKKETKTDKVNTKTEANNKENQEASKKAVIKNDMLSKETKNSKEKNKKKDKSKNVNDILDIIINYFIDYTEDLAYTEFRFLGPFDHKERSAIDMFFEVCRSVRTIERSKEVLDLFDCNNYYLELRLDNNGRYVVHKTEKSKEETPIQNV